ncbi:MFS transporter [Candidatus Omnitrophota bacterium]
MLSLLRIKDRLFYGWVIVIASLIIGLIIFGTRLSFGVFFKSLEAEFELTRAVTSGVFSAFSILCCLIAILGGWALDKYGPRLIASLMGLFTGLSLLLTSQTTSHWQLFLSYSLLLSIGIGAAYIVLMATVSRWFDKKRGLALGIATSGGGLGVIATAPFSTYLISSLGWRMAYIVMGVIAWLTVISLSRLLKKDPSEIGELPDGIRTIPAVTGILGKEGIREGKVLPTGFSFRQALRNRNYWFLAIIWLLYAFCAFLVLTHIIPHVTDLGIPPMKAAGVLSLIGGFNVIGRLIIGTLSDRVGRRLAAIVCVAFNVAAMIWLIWAHDLLMLYLFAIVYGFTYGGFDACIVAIVGDIFGMRRLGVIMGTLSVAFSIGAAIGSFFGGLIFDVTGSYNLAFLIGAAAMLLIILFTTLIRGRSIPRLTRANRAM